MMNGHDQGKSRKDLVVSGRAQQATGDADTSSFYGDYEQRLASELSELLVAGSAASHVDTSALSGLGHAARLDSGGFNRYSALGASQLPKPTALQQATPGVPRTFEPAAQAQIDYATADDDYPPLPYSWMHEPRPAQPSWIQRQMRAGLLGLGAGLVVVLPAIAVISGRFDSWLPVERKSGADRATQAVPDRPAQRLTVAAAAPVATPVAAPALPSNEPPAVRAAAVTVPFVPQAMASPMVSEPIQVQSRSVVTVEPFPPATGASKLSAGVADKSADSAVTTRGVAVTAVNPPAAANPVRRPASEAAGLLELGLTMIGHGDVAAARAPLTKAANAGSAEAMLVLGETYDPNMLAAWSARNVAADVGAARQHYKRALAAGLQRAKARLDALN